MSNKIYALDDVDIYVCFHVFYQGRQVPPVEQKLPSLSEQLSSFPFVVGFVWLNLLFSMLCCVDHCFSFYSLSFWSLICLSFDLHLMITPLVSSNCFVSFISSSMG